MSNYKESTGLTVAEIRAAVVQMLSLAMNCERQRGASSKNFKKMKRIVDLLKPTLGAVKKKHRGHYFAFCVDRVSRCYKKFNNGTIANNNLLSIEIEKALGSSILEPLTHDNIISLSSITKEDIRASRGPIETAIIMVGKLFGHETIDKYMPSSAARKVYMKHKDDVGGFTKVLSFYEVAPTEHAFRVNPLCSAFLYYIFLNLMGFSIEKSVDLLKHFDKLMGSKWS